MTGYSIKDCSTRETRNVVNHEQSWLRMDGCSAAGVIASLALVVCHSSAIATSAATEKLCGPPNLAY